MSDSDIMEQLQEIRMKADAIPKDVSGMKRLVEVVDELKGNWERWISASKSGAVKSLFLTIKRRSVKKVHEGMIPS